MSSIISWLQEVFLVPSATQTIIVISLVCTIGLLLSKIELGKISLGITFVFFVGILAAHFGLSVDPTMLAFAQNFGLVLFIYALGVQVGPSFFPSLRKGGVKDNLLSLLLVGVTLLLCWGIYLFSGVSMPEIIGIMSGAVTNTPVLAAAQSTLAGLDPSSSDVQSNMALACAVAYPLGVVGMILAMVVLRTIKDKHKNNSEEGNIPSQAACITEFEVRNPAVLGYTLEQLAKQESFSFVITRLWHNGAVSVPTSQTRLLEGDRILVSSHSEDVVHLERLFGLKCSKDWNRADIDWNALDHQLVSKRIIITRKDVNGEKLGALRLRNLYGVNITRIDRLGVELLPTPSLRLQLGDRLTIVGEASAIDSVQTRLGNEIQLLDAPNLLSLFLGLLLGCAVGMIPLFIPGISIPIRLGLAGGPIIIGILMGAYGPRFHLCTYITNSASLLLRQLGVIIYLACLGLSSGANFFSIIFNGDGLLWIFLGFLITLLPILLVGWLAMRFAGRGYGATCGMLCGSMANPMALDFLEGKVSDDSHNVVYATVYPLSMFARIITAQILLLLFVS